MSTVLYRASEKIKKVENESNPQPAPSPALEPEDPGSPGTGPRPWGGDYYFDGPYMVFTAAYLLKRGTCCGSGCRHCPYRGTDRDRNPPVP